MALNGMIRYDSEEYIEKIVNADGGVGSGNWGHVGIPGKRGGSGKGGGVAYRVGSKEGGYKKAEFSRLSDKEKIIAQNAKSGGGEAKEEVLELTAFPDMRAKMEIRDVDYMPLKKMATQLSEEAIIDKVSGADKTKGSCASVAFIYGANKAGYDANDFRGGKSREVWADRENKIALFKETGVKHEVVNAVNDYEACSQLFSRMQQNKEYVLMTGRHAAAVKKDSTGQVKYLELQSGDRKNTWYDLGRADLKDRFSCKKSRSQRDYFGSHRVYCDNVLVDLESFTSNSSAMQMLGFLNTPKGQEVKGAGGGEK